MITRAKRYSIVNRGYLGYEDQPLITRVFYWISFPFVLTRVLWQFRNDSRFDNWLLDTLKMWEREGELPEYGKGYK